MAILNAADPLGLFLLRERCLDMVGAAILIDGGYFLKRLPAVCPDVDASDAELVAKSVSQRVRSHLEHLNKMHHVPDRFRLLYRTFYCDAWPYDRRGHTPIRNRSVDYGRTLQAKFRKKLFKALHGSPTLLSGWVRYERTRAAPGSCEKGRRRTS